jgi:hypothetical protein
MTEEISWKQVVAGIDILNWSKLASWNPAQGRLNAAKDEVSFDTHWDEIHHRSGRWLCWIAFSVGAESLVRGAFSLHGHEIQNFGASHPWNRLNMPVEYHTEVAATIYKLATQVRNRDAHRYLPDVRATDFPLIDSEFVPALNRIIECLDRDGLRERYASSSDRSQT